MRRLATVLMILAAGSFVAGQAMSVERTLSKRYGKSELKSACEAAGGTYGEGPGGYGCEKQCTSGGDYCTISCSNDGGNCKGDTPSRVAPTADVKEILRGGAGVMAPDKAPSAIRRAPTASPPADAVRK